MQQLSQEMMMIVIMAIIFVLMQTRHTNRSDGYICQWTGAFC